MASLAYSRSSSIIRLRPQTRTHGLDSIAAWQRMLLDGQLKQSATLFRTSDNARNRHMHTRRNVSSSAVAPETEIGKVEQVNTMDKSNTASKMSCLTWPVLLRSYAVSWITTNPLLLHPTLAVLSFFASSKLAILDPDRNPAMRSLMKRAFYAHFCAGENPQEVRRTINNLKSMGFKGVVMGHARETILSRDQESQLLSSQETTSEAEQDLKDVQTWKQNALDTLAMAEAGEFIALKFSGAGKQALKHMKQTIAPAPALADAMHEICKDAQNRSVGVLFDAEQASIQQAIDDWTLEYMKVYNKGEMAIVYGTYQAYAKRTPELLAQHLEEAKQANFVLGVKLVRGAYLAVDPRHLFWSTIEETHNCYDNLAKCIIEQKYGGLLKPGKGKSGEFPRVDFVLASHNAESVSKARKLRDLQAQTGTSRVRMSYAQLMGMADHVSCDIINEAQSRAKSSDIKVEVPQAYKYLVWGTTGECMKYLLRRARENQDAVSRTMDARKALGNELAYRLGLKRS